MATKGEVAAAYIGGPLAAESKFEKEQPTWLQRKSWRRARRRPR